MSGLRRADLKTVICNWEDKPELDIRLAWLGRYVDFKSDRLEAKLNHAVYEKSKNPITLAGSTQSARSGIRSSERL